MTRWYKRAFAYFVGSFLLAGTALAGGTIDDLDISLAAEKSAITGQQEINVRLTITNKTDETISVPRPELPQKTLATPIFSVTDSSGEAVRYVGPLIKWGPKALKETVNFAPGTHREYTVNLGRSYQFGNGTYKIEYVGAGVPEARKQKLSAPVTITIQGLKKSSLEPAPRTLTEPADDLAALSRSEPRAQTYSYCTAGQRTAIAGAARGALSYAKAARYYFTVRTPGTATQRYRTWFGRPYSTYWSTVKTHYRKIYAALATQTINYDCSCYEDYYAYVYPSEPYNIYLCNSYWSAPTRGTDSKAGTIIHEMSHFTVLGGTEDWAYGQINARNLALRYPSRAIDNADNHEYFAENTPWQP